MFVSDMPWVEGQLNLFALHSIFASRTRREPKARRIYLIVSLSHSSQVYAFWLLYLLVQCCGCFGDLPCVSVSRLPIGMMSATFWLQGTRAWALMSLSAVFAMLY